jgi:dihydroorotate dehydrogenase electron transfer subunit
MLDETAHLCFSLEVARGFCLTRLAAPRTACEVKPGQFVELRVGSGPAPLLRLPLSVAGVDRARGTIDLLFEERGPKTRALRRLSPGDRVECLGPLGHGFVLPAKGTRVLLVGGGIGIPPLLFLGDAIRHGGVGPACLLAGARSRDRHLPDALLASAGLEVRRATDDGSLGHRGPVTELLEQGLEQDGRAAVYSCGPHAMLAAVAATCHRREVACQVSLEAYMACGIGVCVGCVVEMAPDYGVPETPYRRYRRVCVDGPVFDSRRVRWEEACPT